MFTRKIQIRLRNFCIMLGIIAFLLSAKAFADLVYQPVSQTDFETGTISGGNTYYRDWLVQSNTGDIVIAPAPGGKGGNAAKVSISKNENFSNVANGSPRAELQSGYTLALNTYYTFSFNTYIPSSSIFDKAGYEQRMDFFQTHQNTPDMSDGWAIRGLGLDGTHYYVDDYTVSNKQILGDASADVGKWVHWVITYKVAATDGSGLYAISKNGTQVYSDSKRTFYSGQSPIYCKFGVYKWDWLNYATQVSNVTMYFDDIILSKGTNSTVSSAPAAPSNLAFRSLYKGATTGAEYVNLSWANNATNATAIQVQQSVNSTNNFQTVMTIPATSITAAVNIGTNPTGGTYYYRLVAVNSAGQSQPSNTVSAQIASITPPVAAPTAPSNLTYTGLFKGALTGDTFVSLSWKDNSSNETGFLIQQSINSTGNFQTIKTPVANSIQYSVNIGLKPVIGTYYYRVIAVNASGNSQASNVISIKIT